MKQVTPAEAALRGTEAQAPRHIPVLLPVLMQQA